MAQVTIEANAPIAIISTPLRARLFLLKMALLAPTTKRQPVLAIAKLQERIGRYCISFEN
jgi:hypothetical protein